MIVEGEISEVSSFAYEYKFHVKEHIKGQSDQNIVINMWKEWTCDHRIQRPKKGQRLLLFLKERDNREYEIINGSTGELFITENDSVKTFGRHDLPVLNELKCGIEMFSHCYEYCGDLYSSYKEKTYFLRKEEQSEIEKIMNENAFFKSMVLRIKPSIMDD